MLVCLTLPPRLLQMACWQQAPCWQLMAAVPGQQVLWTPMQHLQLAHTLLTPARRHQSLQQQQQQRRQWQVKLSALWYSPWPSQYYSTDASPQKTMQL
jgi:hypothetical protein